VGHKLLFVVKELHKLTLNTANTYAEVERQFRIGQLMGL
jgi:hypothetical protein